MMSVLVSAVKALAIKLSSAISGASLIMLPTSALCLQVMRMLEFKKLLNDYWPVSAVQRLCKRGSCTLRGQFILHAFVLGLYGRAM
jgi:hypothetical protein